MNILFILLCNVLSLYMLFSATSHGYVNLKNIILLLLISLEQFKVVQQEHWVQSETKPQLLCIVFRLKLCY